MENLLDIPLIHYIYFFSDSVLKQHATAQVGLSQNGGFHRLNCECQLMLHPKKPIRYITFMHLKPNKEQNISSQRTSRSQSQMQQQ